MSEYLEKLHAHLLILLREIDRVCQENDLSYFIIGGTLLGKEVHNGFIPWDDDLDVGMLRADYEKLLQLPPSAFGEKFYLHSKHSDPDYWLPFVKLKEKGTTFIEKGRENRRDFGEIYLDIFPFETTNQQMAERKKAKYRRIRHLDNYINLRGSRNAIKGKMCKLYHGCYQRTPLIRLSNQRDRLMRSYHCENGKALFDIAGGRSLENSFFKAEEMLPLQKIDFCGVSTFAPKNPAYYLETLYTRRYLVIPEPKDQITHEPICVDFGE